MNMEGLPYPPEITGNQKFDTLNRMTEYYLSLPPEERDEYVNTINDRFQQNGAPEFAQEVAKEFVEKVKSNKIIN